VQQKLEVLVVAKTLLFFWNVMTKCRLTGRYQRFSKKYEYTVSTLRAKYGSVPNKTEVVEKRSAQFPVTAVAQQSFHVTMFVISYLRKWLWFV
jgi:hypothetical protein